MQSRISSAGLALVFVMLCVAAPGDPDPAMLDKKVLLGYQGWFNCAGDGAPEDNWRSWARGAPAPATLTIDMYPDLSEFRREDLCGVPGMTIAGKPAYLFSAWNRNVVLRHFRWMKDYGLDGVLVQRFVTNIARRRASGDVLLKNILAGAAESGRVFAIEYDVTGSNLATFAETMREDWKYLVDELKITAHPRYLRHNGKPVLSVWGPGLHEDRHVPHDPAAARGIVEWFRTGAPPAYRVTYMGGTPSRWRTLTNDARPDPGWAGVYAMMDVVQPWAVGRYRDSAGVDKWKDDMIVPDVALAARNKQIYMPVIFPGFSWNNLKRDAPKNAIPRNRGEFLWRQAYNAKVAGATVLKIAMFDEVNEGTAVFKVAARRQDAPDQGYWLTLDADGANLPSDWYLRLSGEITRMFHGEIPPDPKLPEKPGPPWQPARGR
jgi:hypothetical protein